MGDAGGQRGVASNPSTPGSEPFGVLLEGSDPALFK